VNLADEGPLLLAVDDAHWADPSSMQFLGYLARRIEGLPVLLLAAARPADPDGEELWRELTSDPAAEILRPGALSEPAVAQLLRSRLGTEVDGAFSAACHEATGGNPLFLRELVAALEAAHVEPNADAAAAVETVGPPAVGRFVLRRLERLGAPATELARTVAVLGGTSDLALAARAARIEAEEARRVADLLVRADVFAADRELGFVHPIVEAAIYEDLLPGERAARHAAVAKLLEDSGAPAERVATHLLQTTAAGDPATVATLRAAAASAAQRGAPAAAIGYLRRALDEPPADDQRAAVLVDLGELETTRLDHEAAEAHLLAALDSPGDPAEHARAAIWLSRASISFSRPQAARLALEALLEQRDKADAEGALELEAAAVVLTRLELSLRELSAERLDEFLRRAGDNARFEPIARLHAIGERQAAGAPAAEVADDVSAIMRAGPPADPFVFHAAIDLLIRTERYDAAAPYIEAALQTTRALGLPAQVAALHTERALLGVGRGALADADLDVQLALELIPDGHFLLPHVFAVAMAVALERGELERAQELAARHPEQLERERLFVDRYLVSRGRVRSAGGNARGALADFERCAGFLEVYKTPALISWRPHAVAALIQLGDEERARALAREEIAAARSFGAPGELSRALRSGGVAVGGDEGLALLEEAVTVAERSAARLEAAHALADLGGELVRCRRRREGREALRRALELARACGAAGLVERVRGDLGAGGGRAPRLELTGVEALTPAERRVCELAAGERTNRDIAQQLFVTEKTVELHLTNAYRKLGIRSRFQLASVLASE
jgi:DNA-binding CsgD family transcriptional regulator